MISKRLLLILTVFLATMVLSIWILLFLQQQKSGLDLYCSTFLHFDNEKPSFAASVDISFRLQPDHSGNVAINGNLKGEGVLNVIARTVSFNYRIINNDEIALSDMNYVKNTRDNTNDTLFRKYFFYVPEGTERVIRLRASRNGYLIENEQSPVFMCLNKY